MELLDAIAKRRAIRSYENTPVEDSKLDKIVMAGCIMQNMMLEATEQGLGSVVVWGSSMVVNAVPDLKEGKKHDFIDWRRRSGWHSPAECL